MNTPHAPDVRLQLAQLAALDPPEAAQSVGGTSLQQHTEPLALRALGGDHELAALLVRYSMA